MLPPRSTTQPDTGASFATSRARAGDSGTEGLQRRRSADPREESGRVRDRSGVPPRRGLRLTAANKQGELFLTDLVAIAARQAASPRGMAADELYGVNDRAQLAAASATRLRRCMHLGRAAPRARSRNHVHRRRRRDRPGRVIEPQVHLRGRCRSKAARTSTSAACSPTYRRARAPLQPYTRRDRAASIGERARSALLAPASRQRDRRRGAHRQLRRDQEDALGRGAKANHLAYLGDGDIGEGANVGAGTIFCNYDGFEKHTTEHRRRRLHRQRLAARRAGDDRRGRLRRDRHDRDADVPAGALAIGRARQENKPDFANRLRERLKAQADKAKAAKK